MHLLAVRALLFVLPVVFVACCLAFSVVFALTAPPRLSDRSQATRHTAGAGGANQQPLLVLSCSLGRIRVPWGPLVFVIFKHYSIQVTMYTLLFFWERTALEPLRCPLGAWADLCSYAFAPSLVCHFPHLHVNVRRVLDPLAEKFPFSFISRRAFDCILLFIRFRSSAVALVHYFTKELLKTFCKRRTKIYWDFSILYQMSSIMALLFTVHGCARYYREAIQSKSCCMLSWIPVISWLGLQNKSRFAATNTRRLMISMRAVAPCFCACFQRLFWLPLSLLLQAFLFPRFLVSNQPYFALLRCSLLTTFGVSSCIQLCFIKAFVLFYLCLCFHSLGTLGT